MPLRKEKEITMTDRPDLDEKIQEIINNLVRAVVERDRIGITLRKLHTNSYKKDILALFTEHAKEAKRQEEIDTLKWVLVQCSFTDGLEDAEYIENRLTQLKQDGLVDSAEPVFLTAKNR